MSAAEQTVGFDVLPLPFPLGLANRAFDRLGVKGPVLTPENVTRAASRRAGLPDRFPSHIGEALEVLCRSLHDEAKLHWFGRMNNFSLMVTGLAVLLQVEQAFRDDPTLETQELIPPLIVTGLPRSGTTFLHRLLSNPENATGIPLYRHVSPLPHKPVDYRRLDVAVMFEPWRRASRTYQMDAIHFVRPDLPDECNFGMRTALRSMIYWSTAPVHGYLRWLLAQDLRESYQLYRKVLQIHQRQLPGRRIVLKCPHHLAWLPALTEALPEAHIVQTHRDPVVAVPSECSLVCALQALSTDELDWERTVESNHLKVHTFSERAVAFADSRQGERVFHIDYHDLVAAPVDVAARIHARFGIPFGEEDRAGLVRYFAENKQHKHGRHTYSLEQFGLDADRVRASFAPYRARFLAEGEARRAARTG